MSILKLQNDPLTYSVAKSGYICNGCVFTCFWCRQRNSLELTPSTELNFHTAWADVISRPNQSHFYLVPNQWISATIYSKQYCFLYDFFFNFFFKFLLFRARFIFISWLLRCARHHDMATTKVKYWRRWASHHQFHNHKKLTTLHIEMIILLN